MRLAGTRSKHSTVGLSGSASTSRLGVVRFLEILCTRIEGEQLLEQPVIRGQLNHGAPGAVPTDDVAPVEQVVQQRSGLSAGVEWQRGNGHWSSLLRRGSTLAGDG